MSQLPHTFLCKAPDSLNSNWTFRNGSSFFRQESGNQDSWGQRDVMGKLKVMSRHKIREVPQKDSLGMGTLDWKILGGARHFGPFVFWPRHFNQLLTYTLIWAQGLNDKDFICFLHFFFFPFHFLFPVRKDAALDKIYLKAEKPERKEEHFC